MICYYLIVDALHSAERKSRWEEHDRDYQEWLEATEAERQENFCN